MSSTPDRILWLFALALVGLAFLFAFAGIFLDDFRETGAGIATITLGALSTVVTGLIGTRLFSAPFKEAIREKRDEGEGGSEANGVPPAGGDGA